MFIFVTFCLNRKVVRKNHSNSNGIAVTKIVYDLIKLTDSYILSTISHSVLFSEPPNSGTKF